MLTGESESLRLNLEEHRQEQVEKNHKEIMAPGDKVTGERKPLPRTTWPTKPLPVLPSDPLPLLSENG